MDLVTFKKLNQEKKIDLIIHKAMFLNFRVVAGETIHLYFYDGIFIEVSFVGKKMDAFFNAFTGIVPLYSYLDNIQIDKSLGFAKN